MANVIYADFMNLVGRVEALERGAAPGEPLTPDERKTLQDEIVRLRTVNDDLVARSHRDKAYTEEVEDAAKCLQKANERLNGEAEGLKDKVAALAAKLEVAEDMSRRGGEALAQERAEIDRLQRLLKKGKEEREEILQSAMTSLTNKNIEVQGLKDKIAARELADSAVPQDILDLGLNDLEGMSEGQKAKMAVLRECLQTAYNNIAGYQALRKQDLAEIETLRARGATLDGLLAKKEEFILEQASKMETLVREKQEMWEIANNNYKMYTEAKEGKTVQDLREVIKNLEGACAMREDALTAAQSRVRRLEWVIRGVRTAADSVVLPEPEDGVSPVEG